VLAAVLLCTPGRPAFAWTDPSRVLIVDDALRLLPSSLRKLLGDRRQALIAALVAPGSSEDRPEHWQHPEGAYGIAARRAQLEAEALVTAVDAHEPLAQIVARFGRLAHWVADVNDPLHTADRDPRLARYYVDYEEYLESQIPRFRLVFLGYRADELSRSGPRTFLLQSAGRSREYARAVGRAYTSEGVRVSPQAFDERSLAFGVGSLAYSNAVNDIVRVWLWAWEGCNGDTTGTPFPLPPVGSPGTPGAAEGVHAP
jgi:hypothetical protein